MRIDRKSASDATERRRRLLRLVEQPGPSEVRSCGGCQSPCKAHRSRDCACECSIQCPHIASAMSSDPVRYPIEATVAPLVYAFASLRSTQPCWSCEGHTDATGTILSKLPAVWFYVDSIETAGLVSRFLVSAKHQLKLSSQWHLQVTFGESQEVAFSCTPNTWALEGAVGLRELQQDLAKLAGGLRTGVLALARSELSRM